MKKAVLLMIVSIFFSTISWSAGKTTNATETERIPAISFEKLVSNGHNAMASDQPTYNVNEGQAWVKRRHIVSNVTYDVKKTDSLLNPIVGFVNFSVVIEESVVIDTKAEVLKITTFKESPFKYEVLLNYSYIDAAWKFKNSRVKMFYNGKLSSDWAPSEEEIMSGKFIVPLHYWMPSR